MIPVGKTGGRWGERVYGNSSFLLLNYYENIKLPIKIVFKNLRDVNKNLLG